MFVKIRTALHGLIFHNSHFEQIGLIGREA